jgi:hypothetical protein
MGCTDDSEAGCYLTHLQWPIDDNIPMLVGVCPTFIAKTAMRWPDTFMSRDNMDKVGGSMIKEMYKNLYGMRNN